MTGLKTEFVTGHILSIHDSIHDSILDSIHDSIHDSIQDNIQDSFHNMTASFMTAFNSHDYLKPLFNNVFLASVCRTALNINIQSNLPSILDQVIL